VAIADRPATPRGLRQGDRLIEVAEHNCFACGTLNAHGLHLELHAQDGVCWSELELPARFEGWEGIAHGGIVATILDEVMAWSLIEQDAWGVTARMTVDFRKPVRIGRRIRGEGRLVEDRRRLFRTHGRLLDGLTGHLLAEAEGTYLAAPEERKRELKDRYQFRLVDEPDVVDGSTAGQPIGDPTPEPRPWPGRSIRPSDPTPAAVEPRGMG
jgi:acyl-coenzyme A thioesterase PaaI-like protein